MKKWLIVVAILSLPAMAQMSGYNVPATGVGLLVCIGPGSNTISGTLVTYTGSCIGPLTLNATTFGYLDASAGTLLTNTTGAPTHSCPIFEADTNQFFVTAVRDKRPVLCGGSGGGVPGGSTTQVQFNNAGSFGADANFVWDNTNKLASLGGLSSTTQGLLTIIGAATGSGQTPIETHSSFSTGLNLYTHANAAFRGPLLNFFRSEGTQASPSAISAAGDTLGYIQFGGYNGTSYVSNAELIQSLACQSWSATQTCAYFDIYTNPISTTVAVKAMALAPDGSLIAQRGVLATFLGHTMTSTNTVSGIVPAKIDTSNNNSVVATTTSDTGAGVPIGFIVGTFTNYGTSGGLVFPISGGDSNTVIQIAGLVTATSSTSCSRGNFVIVSTTVNGDVACTGTFTAGTILGVATTAPGGAGPVTVAVGLR